MTNREKLIQAIAAAGIPDRVQVGLFGVGGLHERVADMLVKAIREKSYGVVRDMLDHALKFAELVAQEGPQIPPMAPPLRDGR